MTGRGVRPCVLLLAAGALALACACAHAATRTIVIDAPSPFKALLEKNLDVERAARLPEEESPDDAEWARLVAAVPAQARALAQTEGYFHPDVTVEADPADATRIRVRLVPDAPARVGRFNMEFDGELAAKADAGDKAALALQGQLRDGWGLPPGKVFRNADWDGAKAQTLVRLRAEGYAAAQWTATAAQVDPENDQVRVFLVVDTGPRFLLGDIAVEGLERQPERNVRLLAGFGPGTPLTQQRLQDYQDRLDKTGLFDQVAVVYDPDPAQATHATLTVKLHEQKINSAQVGLGFSTTTGPRVSFEHTTRKAFGYPVTVTNKLQWGRDVQEWDASLATHPAESFHSWITGLSLSRIRTTDDDVRAGYIRFGRTQDSNPLDRMTFAQFERSVQCTQYNCVDARALSLNQHGVWRRLDSVILPTEGYSISGQVGAGWAGGPDSAYGPYARLYGRFTGYWPLGNSWYSQGRLELGQIIVKDTVAMPDAEQWRAGGEDSVRGYAWRSLAPLDQYGQVVGGNSLVTTSAEIAHPFTASVPSVWWAAFVDAGRAAPRFNDLKMALGYGVGVRWRSPVGPLKVDWSWGQEIHAGRIDLAIGIAF